MNFSLKDKKIGIIGMGHIGQAIVNGLLASGTLGPTQILITNRTPGKIDRMVSKYGCVAMNTPEELVDESNVVILATKPQDMLELLEPLRKSFRSDQIIISLAAGLQLSTLRKYIGSGNVVRIMPNTPIFVCQAVMGFAQAKPDIVVEEIVKSLFSPLGLVVSLEEGDPFAALTVAAASGTGFIFELMGYWQEWIEEHGVEKEDARRMVIETFLGTAMLAKSEVSQSFQALTDKVASKKGVTAAGLQSMRELELEGILRMSFNKAIMRDQELGNKT